MCGNLLQMGYMISIMTGVRKVDFQSWANLLILCQIARFKLQIPCILNSTTKCQDRYVHAAKKTDEPMRELITAYVQLRTVGLFLSLFKAKMSTTEIWHRYAITCDKQKKNDQITLENG